MRKYGLYVVPVLLVSLFVYVFYRTEKTIINQIAASALSLPTYRSVRDAVRRHVPLEEHLIYSLPEGLWIFCITLTSRSFYIRLARRQIAIVYLPLLFAIGLEICQLFHFTNGRFDFWDILAALVFWALGAYGIEDTEKEREVFSPFNYAGGSCVLSYAIVYLAHVRS